MLRRSQTLRSVQCSNLCAHPCTGRWFNPPHQWMATDVVWILGTFILCCWWSGIVYGGTISPYSPYMAKNYYPTQRYSKEFIHKYDRTNRWRHY